MSNKRSIHLENDLDAEETQEWLDALDSVCREEGVERAHFLIQELIERMRRSGVHLPYKAVTAYVNTIAPVKEAQIPGEPGLEHRIRSIIRWNAMAMVARANKHSTEYGGHIATFASVATLFDVGFNHFWRAPSEKHAGDLVYLQGHASPGIYARAFLEGRLGEDQLEKFRMEVGADGGLSSYPHPWLMPSFWQFSTVSMGLSSLMAIYQARFMKYLHNRELLELGDRKVWVTLGDGEMDEPESLGAISLAAREGLDNLVFVINCNLQRLDGPVRGNGKIIQELEGVFRGAGWNVIKVIWGGRWDPLLAKDYEGRLLRRMEEACDGDYQNYKHQGGAYVREHFFGTDPKLREMVANMTDDEIWHLNRGGHDPQKVYAAYHEAMQSVGKPTVILAKTVKGYGLGKTAGEGTNVAHQAKKMTGEELRTFRDRYRIPISDEQLDTLPFYKPAADSPEMQYLHERRSALGGYLPSRQCKAAPLEIPSFEAFAPLLESSKDRTMSTTMAFVRALTILTRDKKIGARVVPIVPDEARTFGIEGLFRTLGIYSGQGQRYKPVDADQVMYYREDVKGQILEEGITEAGSFCSWLAAATSYSNHAFPMMPFFIFYSMFGFQRFGDFAWAAGDSRARGFLIGATAGRTTLAGEGLQHQDGHSLIAASTIPNCVAYDPAYSYELAVILYDGMKRMFVEEEDVFYYITAMNENYSHPALPEGEAVKAGILRGMYLLEEASPTAKCKVQLLGGGAILLEVRAAAEILRSEFEVDADLWSVTSFNELRRDGLDVDHWNRMHPAEPSRESFVTSCLKERSGPVIAATDYVKLYADQIRPWVPETYTVLGTDGFGRSDARKQLRHFFEVDRFFIVLATLKTLADRGVIQHSVVSDAMRKYGISSEKPNPLKV